MSDGNATRRHKYRKEFGKREHTEITTLMTGSSKGSNESSFNCLCFGYGQIHYVQVNAWAGGEGQLML